MHIKFVIFTIQCQAMCEYVISEAPAHFLLQISSAKMKADFLKLLKLFEDLKEAGVSATLSFSTKGSRITARLHLESSRV